MRSPRNLVRIVSVSAILVAGLLSSGRARAEADTFALGSGRTGAAAITTASTVVNKYASITATVASAATTITVDSGATFAAGDLVLVWQTTGLPVAPGSGVQVFIGLNAISTGSFEYARVKSVAGNIVTLTNPIASTSGYAAGTSQLVFVPEYTTLSIAAGGSIVATPWNGAKGGIVVLFATGAVTNDGVIDASTSGFRGGTLQNDATAYECAANDGPAGNGGVLAGGAHKGEGLYPADYSQATTGAADATYGRGNVANGGGGGDCHNAGGGGGGSAALGGTGGNTWTGETPIGDRAVGGLGGAGLTYDPTSRLAFGGGGGAGEENNDHGSAGGNGGGVVLLRVSSLAGSGFIGADGQSSANSADDGAGGGGAGGLIVVRASTSANCGGIHANGGAGGSSAATHGPGAGGSGGITYLQSASGTCGTTETAGAAGDSGDGGTRGSLPGTGGVGITPLGGGGFTPTPCNIATNKCGGCVTNSDCGSVSTCDTTTNECVEPDGGIGIVDGGSITPDGGADGGSSSDGGLLTDGGSGSDGGSSTGDGGSSGGDGGLLADGGSNGGDGGNANGDGGSANGGNGNGDDGSLEGGGCSTSGNDSGEGTAALGLGLVAALAFMRRKKR